MRSISIFFLLSLVHLLLANNDPKCPSDYFFQSNLNLCLFYPNSIDPWESAEVTCWIAGGHLLSIHNAFQNSLIAQLQYNLTGTTKAWLGAQNVNGHWKWSDKTPFDYQRFNNNQSTVNGTCAYLDQRDLLWKTASCSSSYKYLCASPTIPTNNSTTQIPTIPTSQPDLQCFPPAQQDLYNCRQGWQYFPTTGYQYLVAFDQGFVDGEKFCVSQGAHLASVHSAAENDFILNLCCVVEGCKKSQNTGSYAQFLIGGIGKGAAINGFIWSDGTPVDYQSEYCGEHVGRDDAQLRILGFQGCNECGRPGIWILDSIIATARQPYIVCKKK